MHGNSCKLPSRVTTGRKRNKEGTKENIGGDGGISRPWSRPRNLQPGQRRQNWPNPLLVPCSPHRKQQVPPEGPHGSMFQGRRRHRGGPELRLVPGLMWSECLGCVAPPSAVNRLRIIICPSIIASAFASLIARHAHFLFARANICTHVLAC